MRISRPRHKRHVLGNVWAPGLPLGVRIVALERAVRWAGWGFGEALLPVFIFAFVASYAEAGLLKSVFEITLLFCLPFIGMLADRTSARVLILAGLAVYPLVGISYLLAGVTGLAFFIVAGRFSNAIGWALESTGVDTYYRRIAPQGRVASAFGFIDTLAESAWMVAAFVGMALIVFVPVHWLLFLIAPTSAVAFLIALRAPRDRVEKEEAEQSSLASSYRLTVAQWREWGSELRLLGVLVFFMGIIEALIWFFLPIDAYLEGASLVMVILIMVVASAAPLFGYIIGRIADGSNKFVLTAFGLLCAAGVLAALAVFPQYGFKLAASFLLGLILELFSIVQKSLVTVLGPAATYGLRGGAFSSIGDLGDIAAPLALGVALDMVGFPTIAIIVAWAAIALSLSFSALGFRSKKV